jgi:hypothetical protein
MSKRRESEGSKAGNVDASCKICPTTNSEPIQGARQVDPALVVTQFMDHCIFKGWIITRRAGKRTAYFVTEDGQKELERLDITR